MFVPKEGDCHIFLVRLYDLIGEWLEDQNESRGTPEPPAQEIWKSVRGIVDIGSSEENLKRWKERIEKVRSKK